MSEKKNENDSGPERPFSPLEVLIAAVLFLWFLITQGVFGGKARPRNNPDDGVNRNGDAVSPDTGPGHSGGTSTDSQ